MPIVREPARGLGFESFAYWYALRKGSVQPERWLLPVLTEQRYDARDLCVLGLPVVSRGSA